MKKSVFRLALLGAVAAVLATAGLANAKPNVFEDFRGAFVGPVTFPTVMFGTPTTYTGTGILVITTQGANATASFVCGVSGPLAIPVGMTITGKIKASGKFSSSGRLNDSVFAPVTSKFKLRGKSLSTSYTLSSPTGPLSMQFSPTFKLSGKSITVSGPATLTYTGFVSPGTFTFKGKRVVD